jgi:hypothetical protein
VNWNLGGRQIDIGSQVRKDPGLGHHRIPAFGRPLLFIIFKLRLEVGVEDSWDEDNRVGVATADFRNQSQVVSSAKNIANGRVPDDLLGDGYLCLEVILASLAKTPPRIVEDVVMLSLSSATT